MHLMEYVLEPLLSAACIALSAYNFATGGCAIGAFALFAGVLCLICHIDGIIPRNGGGR